jgi:hypothetical protein
MNELQFLNLQNEFFSSTLVTFNKIPIYLYIELFCIVFIKLQYIVFEGLREIQQVWFLSDKEQEIQNSGRDWHAFPGQSG